MQSFSSMPVADLVEQLYAGLYQSARHFMAGERASHTLGPTALVNEFFVRTLGTDWEAEARRDFDLFRRGAVRKMAQLLKDHARTKKARKRGRDFDRASVDLTALSIRHDVDIDFKLDVEAAIERLELQPNGSRVATAWRWFRQDGYTKAEIVGLFAEQHVNISESTVKRDIQRAETFIRERLMAADDATS